MIVKLERVKTAGLVISLFLKRNNDLLYLDALFPSFTEYFTLTFRVRTSSGTFLARGRDKIVRNIEKRIADFTFIPVGKYFRPLEFKLVFSLLFGNLISICMCGLVSLSKWCYVSKPWSFQEPLCMFAFLSCILQWKTIKMLDKQSLLYNINYSHGY